MYTVCLVSHAKFSPDQLHRWYSSSLIIAKLVKFVVFRPSLLVFKIEVFW